MRFFIASILMTLLSCLNTNPNQKPFACIHSYTQGPKVNCSDAFGAGSIYKHYCNDVKAASACTDTITCAAGSATEDITTFYKDKDCSTAANGGYAVTCPDANYKVPDTPSMNCP